MRRVAWELFVSCHCLMKKLLLLLLCLDLCTHAAGAAGDALAELTRRSMKSLVLVRNEVGVGSGFLAHFGGQKCLFTNQHVVAGGVKNTFTLTSQAQVCVGTAAAAVDHDIIAYGLSDDTEALEVMIGVEQSVAIGDEVAVLGNPDGMGVIHPLTGRVVGIGPQLVEISAEFVPGSSGSPVVHLKSGKVIAVATYLRLVKADFAKGIMADQVRRFCYRLDSIRKWERVRWNDFQDDAETVEKVHRRTKDIFIVLVCSGKLGSFSPELLRDADVRTAVTGYKDRARVAKSQPERNAAAEVLVKDLRSLAADDVANAQRRIAYDHFAKRMETEVELRGPISLLLEKAGAKPEVFDAESRMTSAIESRKKR